MTGAASPAERPAMERAVVALRELRTRLRALEQAHSEPIAIIGAGCRLPPDLDDPAAFWRLLASGGLAVGPPPASRPELATSSAADPEAPDRGFRRDGAYLSTVDRFDAAFFGIAPREAVALDPQQRLLLETAYEALEHAGLPLDRLAGSATGVFIGAGTEDYAQLGLRAADHAGNDAYAFTGSDLSLAAGRIAYSFGLQGPALVVDTACSSSLVALHLAVQSLRRGESSLALVGGVNLILGWDIGLSLCKARALAADGRCKTFDAAADGYGRGEGCCVLVLKRLGDAIADGDRPLALVLGSAVNQDGASSGLTAPNGLAQQALVRSALRDAQVRPHDVSYVEAHGTGTPLGDPIEVAALGAVLCEGRDRDRTLLLGSVKTQIGHLEAAAGIAGVLKVALALHHERLPPTLHQQALNPQLALDAMAASVVSEARPWPRGGERRVAGVSSFGISGTNAHAILAEAPGDPAPPATPGALSAARGGTVLAISARSEPARRELADRYRGWLRGDGRSVDLDELCRDAARRRTQHPWRLAIAGRTAEQIAGALDAWLRGDPTLAVQAAHASGGGPGPVFVFDGQGGQWPNMGRALVACSPAARQALASFDEILVRRAGWSVLELLRESSGAWVTQTDRAQPALCAIQVALTEHWRSWGVVPAAVVGHSAGEVAAAHAAGVLSLEDAVEVVVHRGRLQQRTVGQGTMATVELAVADVERELASGQFDAAVAAVNAPSTTIVSGATDSVERLVQRLERRGVRARRIAVEFPAHSARMEPLLEEFAAALRGIRPRAAAVPLWSTVRGERARAGDHGARYWARNVRDKVQFASVITALVAEGARTFVEIGPHPILGLSIVQCAEAAGRSIDVLPSMYRDTDDLDALLGSLGALHARGEALDLARLYGDGPRGAFDLPGQPWQRERYWPARTCAVAAPAPRDAGPAVSAPGLLHGVAWDTAPDQAPSDDVAGRWLVLADRGGVGRAVARELVRRGADVSLVFDAPGALERVLRAVPPGPAGAPVRLLDLSNLDLERCEAVDGAASRDGWGRAWGNAAGLVQAISRVPDHPPPRIWMATRGAQPAAGRGGDRVLQAMAWALWGTIAFEHPELAVRRIDLDPAVDHDRDARALVAELLGPEPAVDAVAHRDGLRVTPRLVEAEVTAAPITLRDDASYLVTGGLGALGLGVARSLVQGGARHIALVGRRAPDPAQRAAVAELERAGAHLACFAVDLADRTAVTDLLDDLVARAPLRGVVHAAGVLEDGLVLGHSDAQFVRVVSPKVAGAVHLHTLTAGWPLDFFVMFSSVAGTLCPPGQASYSAANAGLDAIARQRRALGLPAVSIAWGPWADRGMAATLDAAHRSRLAQRGLASLDPATGLSLFGSLLGARAAHVVAMPITERARLIRGFSYADGRPCTLLAPRPGDDAVGAVATTSLVELLLATPESQRQDVLEAEIGRRVCAVLGLEGPLRVDAPFRQLGMDSLMAVMVRNTLSAALDRKLPATILFDHPTVAALARELVGGFVARDDQAQAARPEDDFAFLAELADADLAEQCLSELAGAEGVEL